MNQGAGPYVRPSAYGTPGQSTLSQVVAHLRFRLLAMRVAICQNPRDDARAYKRAAGAAAFDNQSCLARVCCGASSSNMGSRQGRGQRVAQRGGTALGAARCTRSHIRCKACKACR
jgi:hypothetical protein